MIGANAARPWIAIPDALLILPINNPTVGITFNRAGIAVLHVDPREGFGTAFGDSIVKDHGGGHAVAAQSIAWIAVTPAESLEHVCVYVFAYRENTEMRSHQPELQDESRLKEGSEKYATNALLTSIKLEGSIGHWVALLPAYGGIDPTQLLLATLFNTMVQLDPRFGDNSATNAAMSVNGRSLFCMLYVREKRIEERGGMLLFIVLVF